MKITIEKLIYGGSGLGRDADARLQRCSDFGQGRPVFVRKSVPGDELEVTLTKNKKSYSEANIKKILNPSVDRVTPACPYFESCGGCDHQNINYENQLKHKDQILDEMIERNKISIQNRKPIIAGSESELFYRNSIRFEFLKVDGQLKIARHNYLDSKKPVVTDFCLLQSKFSNDLLKEILSLYNKLGYEGDDLWQVKIREGKQTGDFMLEMITQTTNLPFKTELVALLKKFPKVKSAYQTIALDKNIYKLTRKLILGSPVIFEKIGQFTFQISPESFFQTNSLSVKNLYDTIKDFSKLEMGDRVLDLFCGTGSIGIYLSTLAREVVGVEVVPEAIRDANDNAKINKVSNCKFICGDTNVLSQIWSEKFDVIVVDPPRAGLDRKLIEKLIKMDFKRIIYVSCDPATFFRDIKILQEKGLKLQKLQPIDMFPQSHHIELVGELTKLK